MSSKKILNNNSIKFLEKYLNNPSPTGYEWEGQKIWMDYLKPYVDEFITDTYGTAVGVINPKAKFKVVIEGHSDEISWYVNYITDNGLIYVIRNGGSDHQVAPSKWVDIQKRTASLGQLHEEIWLNSSHSPGDHIQSPYPGCVAGSSGVVNHGGMSVPT